MATCSNITSSSDTIIDARIDEWIDRITGAVIGSYGFVEADHDDLKQDLRLWLLEMRASFNPARSCWHTFANRVIKARLLDLVRERTAIKRGWGTVTAMPTDRTSGQLDEGVFVEPSGREPRDESGARDIHRTDLSIDVAQVLESLPGDLRRIAHQLMGSEPKDAWRELGLKKSSFYEAVARLRLAFSRAGLDGSAI